MVKFVGLTARSHWRNPWFSCLSQVPICRCLMTLIFMVQSCSIPIPSFFGGKKETPSVIIQTDPFSIIHIIHW